MDSKNDTPSKHEEPVAASKQEEATAEATARNANADHRTSVINHLSSGNIDAAFQALMTDEHGRPLDYAESRSRYG